MHMSFAHWQSVGLRTYLGTSFKIILEVTWIRAYNIIIFDVIFFSITHPCDSNLSLSDLEALLI